MYLLVCLDSLLKISELVIFILLRRLFLLLYSSLMLLFIVVEVLSRLADLILHEFLLYRLLFLLCLVMVGLRVIIVLCLDYLFMHLNWISFSFGLDGFLVFEVLRLFSGLCGSVVIELVLNLLFIFVSVLLVH